MEPPQVFKQSRKDLFSQSKENSLEAAVLKAGNAERRRELTQQAKEQVLYAGCKVIAVEVEGRGQSPGLLRGEFCGI